MWLTTRLRNPVHVWTYEEITRLGQFGSNMGWFYGFVRGDGKLMFGEIFPGYGVAAQWPHPWWSLRTWFRLSGTFSTTGRVTCHAERRRMEDLFTNRKPTEKQGQLLDAFTADIIAFCDEAIETLPDSRFKSLARTKLEECSMWAKKAIVFTVE